MDSCTVFGFPISIKVSNQTIWSGVHIKNKVYMKTTTTLILILISIISLQAQTVITGGDVSGEWKTADSPFLIDGDIYLSSEDRLIIRPGVEVIFQDYYSFDIAGRVEFIGTPTNEIVFTVQDTTGFYLNDHIGWNGLIFNGFYSNLEEYSVIDYCTVEYSKISGITCLGYPMLLIFNSNLQFNQSAGITLHEYSDIEMSGLTIHHNNGGGIASYSSAPIVNDFVIQNNQGSGVSLYGNSLGTIPTFMNGKIIQNNSTYTGGGISINDAGIDAENIEIVSNAATNGGGIFCSMASGEFRNIIVSDNEAENGAGVQCEFYCYITFDHILLADNHANSIGGGAYINESNVDFINATVTNNSASQGGGLFFYLFSFYENQITNSIIWNNEPDGINSSYESPMINYSNISDVITGIGNIESDPMFVDPDNKDYSLQWSNFPSDNNEKSPCIDAGDPGATLDPDGTVNDMGTYYYDQVIFTAVNETNSINKVRLYPNPIVNEVHIDGAENISKIQVINMMGKVVLEKDTSGLNTEIIDLSFLNSGVHIINLYDTKGAIETKKIVKK